eukprot:2528294-Ditylum_brightwellii.AAC.1
MKVPWTPAEGGHKRRHVTPFLLMIFPISFCPCLWSFLLNMMHRLQSIASCVPLQEPQPPIDDLVMLHLTILELHQMALSS